MSNIPSNTELEKGLQQMFPEPNEVFIDRLEVRLMQEALAVRKETRQPTVRRQPAIRQILKMEPLRGWFAAGAIAVIICVALAVAGPQNVLASVQKLLGYVPGIGFVENPQQPVRVLVEPVQAARDGVTLTVEKVLANTQSTLVRIRVDGIPQDKSLFEPGWGESSHPMLREAGLPDGKTLLASGTLSGAGEFIWAEYTFPPLSAGIDRVTLLLDRLPGLKAGVGPENWAIDLPLREVKSGDGVIGATGEPRVSQSTSGAHLALESLAATQEQTALKLRLATDNPRRKADGEWWKGLVLSDDQGKTLPLSREQTLSGLNDGSIVMLAPRLDPSRRYTLRLDQSSFEYRFASFEPAPGLRLAIPAGVQVGQTWTVDQTLAVEGYPLHITQASLQAAAVEGTILRLTIDPLPGLVGAGLNCKDLEICSSSGFELAQPGKPLTTDIYLKQAPGRTVELKIQMLLETVSGPWEIHFQPDGSQ